MELGGSAPQTPREELGKPNTKLSTKRGNLRWAGAGTFSVLAAEGRGARAWPWAGTAFSKAAPTDSVVRIPEASRAPADAWGAG